MDNNYADLTPAESVEGFDFDMTEAVASAEQDHVEEDAAYWEHYGFRAEAEAREQMDAEWWSPVEQGYYDDDPSPYAGDYSEM